MTQALPPVTESLAEELRGPVVGPDDPSYDEARSVYNGMIDKRPAAIAYCVAPADVAAAVNFARGNGLRVAIRSGGHNGAGLGVCDDGLVIDLSRMKGIRYDPESKTVRVQGGCTWGDIDHETHAYGRAVPSGIISTTGVGGLTLGGGVGNITRKGGLSIDNLIEADVVLANGERVTASPSENEDLLWALRGGGGNFGVVTSFLFRTHPVHTIVGGPTLFDIERSKEIMQWYREFIPNAEEDLNGWFAFLTVPPAPPFPEAFYNRVMCGVVWCYAGPEEKADEVFAPIRDLDPALDGIQPMPFPALQSSLDDLYPPGLQWYWKADFVKELSDEAIDEHVKYGNSMPSPQSMMHLYPIDGAAHRLGKNDTAWSYRDANWVQVMVGVDPDPAKNDELIEWTRSYFEALHPYSAGGAYVNMMMEEGEDRVKASYRDNYDRLARIKAKYDPDNFFRVNQNVKPAS